MPPEIDDAALDFLLARAGLAPSPALKKELKKRYAVVEAMAANVRKPRGHMAELAHMYGFAAEDLA